MAAAGATFTGPNGRDPQTAIRAELQALVTPTTGDLLYVGQIWRARIRTRTFEGMDVNGQPFAPYSTKGPYYFYPNAQVGSTRRKVGTRNHTQAEVNAARATAAKGRFAKTGKIGVRTSLGIKYESYAAAKAAHGVNVVNLYGMEQHTHMLDTMLVKAGGAELNATADMLFAGAADDMDAFQQNVPCYELQIGFYGPEAARAKGHNEGARNLPQRQFFALSPQDLQLGERGVAQRMMIRASSGRSGPGQRTPIPFTGGDDWVSF